MYSTITSFVLCKSIHAWTKSAGMSADSEDGNTSDTLRCNYHRIESFDEALWWRKKRGLCCLCFPCHHAATHDKWTRPCSPIGCERRDHVPPVINSGRSLAPLVFLSLPSNCPAVYWRSAESDCSTEIKILREADNYSVTACQKPVGRRVRPTMLLVGASEYLPKVMPHISACM